MKLQQLTQNVTKYIWTGIQSFGSLSVSFCSTKRKLSKIKVLVHAKKVQASGFPHDFIIWAVGASNKAVT